MVGNHSRTKGHNFERWVARKLRSQWPDAKRGLQYQHGEHCPDVIGTPFFIECKRHKKIRPLQVKQWVAHAIEKRDLWHFGEKREAPPVVIVYREDRGLIVVRVEADYIGTFEWENLIKFDNCLFHTDSE